MNKQKFDGCIAQASGLSVYTSDIPEGGAYLR